MSLWMFCLHHHQILLFLLLKRHLRIMLRRKRIPLNPGPMDSGQEPDPPLAPVHAMAAGAPNAEEILLTARKKAAANISQMQPPSYTSSYSSSDDDEETIPPTGPEPERFI